MAIYHLGVERIAKNKKTIFFFAGFLYGKVQATLLL